MAVKPGVTVESFIDLSGGGQPQEFCHFAWFEPSDLIFLTFPWKRAVYAHITREFRPVIARLRAESLLAPGGDLLLAFKHVLPEEAVDAVVHNFGAAIVLERAAAAIGAPAADSVAAGRGDAGAEVSLCRREGLGDAR